tara:strand:+ start:999 stop:1364 length:366 start_codon:yes stop_codon:yes gene_type:complete
MSLNNLILLSDVHNYNFDFKKLFESKDSIIWKNCSNLTITINSQINKIIFNNCENIKIKCNKTISGIEYFKCVDIVQTISKNHKIGCIDIYSSSLVIKIKNDTVLPKIINEKSNIILEYIT